MTDDDKGRARKKKKKDIESKDMRTGVHKVNQSIRLCIVAMQSLNIDVNWPLDFKSIIWGFGKNLP